MVDTNYFNGDVMYLVSRSCKNNCALIDKMKNKLTIVLVKLLSHFMSKLNTEKWKFNFTQDIKSLQKIILIPRILTPLNMMPKKDK